MKNGFYNRHPFLVNFISLWLNNLYAPFTFSRQSDGGPFMLIKPTELNTVGQTYQNFQVTRAVAIPELQCFLRELVHLPTGAQVMDITTDDPENLFCLSFRTLPKNSNGVAHILEHTVLCGSKKFPVKDPFFAMSRRSLNTFMNALTGSDFTCYPAASQVPKDFYNLLEVYLDAVFHPLLNELSFLQEGHRLEFAQPNNPNSPLEYKGIVFNEMKGALASPSARLAEAIDTALFPNLPYGYNSGGDPAVIPKLTYEELRAFHDQYYHPSRCLFFFSGNMPLEGHLDFISKHALKNVNKVAPIPPLPSQPRFKEPRSLIVPYPISAEEDAADLAHIAFAWLTCHILKQQEVIALNVLELILMDTDASPLKLAFLRSGLCKQASITTDDDISEIPVVITLRGCNAEHADQLEEILNTTLQEVLKHGIPTVAIENAIHQLEFARSEIVGNHSPFGLSLFMRSALLKQHGGNPEDGLRIHSLFSQLRETYTADPHYFTNLLRKYFIDNKHFVRVVMTPEKGLAAKEAEQEQEALKRIRAELSDKQIAQILQKSTELEELQKQQENADIDILPKITLADVPKASRNFSITQETSGTLQVFHHNCFTNQIVYADLIFDLPEIKEADLPFVRLLGVLIPQMGSGGRNYAETLEYIQANTGGMGTSLSFNLQADNYNQFFPAFYIRGKALHHKVDKLFPLIYDMATSVDLSDIDRLKEVLLKHFTSLHSGLIHNALRYSINNSASTLDIPSKVSNIWFGLEYYATIKKLASDLDAQAPLLVQKLDELRKYILTGAKQPHLVLTCDEEMKRELIKQKFYGLNRISTTLQKPWKCQLKLEKPVNEGIIIASPVAFISRVIKTIPYVHPDAPALTVAGGLFENIILHMRVREQGGAYGGGISSNTLSGSFCFYSYRDPHITRTLDAFDEAVEVVLSGKFDQSDLEEAKLEVLQGLDVPVAPGSRGDFAYGWQREGKSLEIRQAFRNRLLSLTRQDVITAVNKYVKGNTQPGGFVVFAGKELLEKENALLTAQRNMPLHIHPI